MRQRQYPFDILSISDFYIRGANMTRKELIGHFFELTEREAYSRNNPSAKPSAFYHFLEEEGYLEADGVYHMPSIFFAYPDSSPPKTWTDSIDKSPYQSIFRIKKATRFQQEPLSYADFLCIRYVYSGEALITTRDSRFVMRQNDILLINSGFVLSQCLMHEDDVVFTLMFEKDYLIHHVLNNKAAGNVISRFISSYIMSSTNPRNYILFHGKDNDRIPRVIEDMLMEYTAPTDLGTILLEAYLQILLVEMSHSDYEFRQDRDSRHLYVIAEILDDIDRNYSTVTLQSLSEKYSYNSDHISRLIRRATGKTFKDYLLDRRMEAVCSALKNTSLPISEIESEAGFQNETYFYKQFRRKYGMTPNEYRGMPG